MHKFLPTLAILLLSALPGFAGSTPQIDAELEAVLETAAPDDAIPVIVELRDQIDIEPFKRGQKSLRRRELVRTLKNHALETQRGLNVLVRREGLSESVPLWLINGIAVTARPALIEKIAGRTDVAGIRLDRRIRLEDAVGSRSTVNESPSRPRPEVAPLDVGDGVAAEWNIDMIRAPELWALGIDGQGIVVANMDSGVDGEHPDLAARWRGGQNSWFDPHGEHASPGDVRGHGTQTMGILVGGAAGGTAIGVAPGAQWIAVKIFDDAGDTSYSAIHEGFQWLLDPDDDPDTDDAPDVVNSSWGLNENIDQCIAEFETDIAALKAAGIALVFSAGNSGPSSATSLSPANLAQGFAVGMVDDAMFVDIQSSRGPSTCDLATYPEVVAPGVFVWTADLDLGTGTPYTEEIGTSFAAPHVSGAMALLLQAYPNATVDELESVLTATAFDLGTTGPDDSYGYGLIDVVQAHAMMSGLPCSDLDGDGIGAGATCLAIDCDDQDDQVWRTPGEALEVRFDDNQTLRWNAPSQAGGQTSALGYDTIRSGDRADFVSAATCVESADGSDTTAVDPDSPVTGVVFYYLVRAVNACPAGLGSLGTGSTAAEREGASCP